MLISLNNKSQITYNQASLKDFNPKLSMSFTGDTYQKSKTKKDKKIKRVTSIIEITGLSLAGILVAFEHKKDIKDYLQSNKHIVNFKNRIKNIKILKKL